MWKKISKIYKEKAHAGEELVVIDKVTVYSYNGHIKNK